MEILIIVLVAAIALSYIFAPWFLILAVSVIVAVVAYSIVKKRAAKSWLRKLEAEYTVDYDFYTKLVGVTYNGIQSILPKLRSGMFIEFRREPKNPYDANAILALCDGKRIGHLSAEIAAEIAPLMDKGIPVTGTIRAITGGNCGKYYGCNIDVVVYKRKNEIAKPVQKISELTRQVENIDKSNPFYMKNCAIFGTGKVHEAQCILNLGGIVKNRVDENTDFVIALNYGWLDGESKNATIAKEIVAKGGKLKILSVDEYKVIKDKYLSDERSLDEKIEEQ